MYKVSKGLDELMVELLTLQMINPQNKDFYVENITIDEVASMLAEMESAHIDITEIFWKAFKKARAILKTNKALGL